MYDQTQARINVRLESSRHDGDVDEEGHKHSNGPRKEVRSSAVNHWTHPTEGGRSSVRKLGANREGVQPVPLAVG